MPSRDTSSGRARSGAWCVARASRALSRARALGHEALAHFPHVAGAEREQEIARAHDGRELGLGGLEIAHVLDVRVPVRPRRLDDALGARARDRLLARRVDVGYQHDFGVAEALAEA